MLKKTLTSLVFFGVSLYAGVASANASAIDLVSASHSSSSSECHHHHHNQIHALQNYAVLSNQVEIVDGDNVFWSPLANTISSGISVDGSGNITLPSRGLFLIEYTVRLSRHPEDDTSTVTTQLQQTVSGLPVNITQAAVISNTAIDSFSSSEPFSQTQITGYALINVTSTSNNVINLAVTISGDQFDIPATAGTDANAQMIILQLR